MEEFSFRDNITKLMQNSNSRMIQGKRQTAETRLLGVGVGNPHQALGQYQFR